MKHDKIKSLQFKDFGQFYRRRAVVKTLYTAMTLPEAWEFKRYVYGLVLDVLFQDAIWKYLNGDLTDEGLATFYKRSKNLRKKEKLGIAK